jgi:hypothetical protein
MPSESEFLQLKMTVGSSRGHPSAGRIFASLLTGEFIESYTLYFAYIGASSIGPGDGFYAPANSESLVKEFHARDAEIVGEEGRVWFRGNKYTEDAQEGEVEPFVADHGYQELDGAIKATFLELDLVLQLVRNVQKTHYPTLSWLVDHGLKVFYEYQDVFGQMQIEKYSLPALPP